MAIKNTKLGGTDFNTPDDRVRPTDLNDTFNASANWQNAIEMQFKNLAQTIFANEYNGWPSNLNIANGTPNFKNVVTDVMTSNNSDEYIGFEYNGTNDLYQTVDTSGWDGEYFVDVYANNSPTININDTTIKTVGRNSSGNTIYRVYATSGTFEEKKAKVIKTLFLGDTNPWDSNPNPQINNFSGVSNIISSDSNDSGKRVIWAQLSVQYESANEADLIGTFQNTSTNNDCHVWSGLAHSADSQASLQSQVEFPVGTTIHTTSGSQNSDESGTDTSNDNQDNPNDIRWYTNITNAYGNPTVFVGLLILCEGTISWDENEPLGSGNDFSNFQETDFGTTIGTFEAPNAETNAVDDTPYIIFNNSTSETVNNAIATWNSDIDSSNSLTVELSSDGSNWETVTDANIHRFSNTGTNLDVRFTISRTDTSTEDKISEYAVGYNWY